MFKTHPFFELERLSKLAEKLVVRFGRSNIDFERHLAVCVALKRCCERNFSTGNFCADNFLDFVFPQGERTRQARTQFKKTAVDASEFYKSRYSFFGTLTPPVSCHALDHERLSNKSCD